jgi:hypothetical protein
MHELTRRYLQSTPLHGRRLREVPTATNNPFDLSKILGFNITNSTKVGKPGILDKLLDANMLFPLSKKANATDPNFLQSLLSSLILM